MDVYYTPVGYQMNYNEFSRDFIATLIDPLAYFCERYDILGYISYFQECEMDIDPSIISV